MPDLLPSSVESFKRFIFQNPDNPDEPIIVRIESADLKPGSPKFKQTMEDIKTLRLKFGDPHVRESDVRPGSIFNILKKQVFRNPIRPNLGTVEERREQFDPDPDLTMPATKFRKQTSMALQTLGSLIPIAGQVSKIPALAKLTQGIPGMFASAFGAFAGEYSAEKLQEGADVTPIAAGPVVAAITDLGGAAVMQAFTRGAVGFARRLLLGDTALEDARKVAAQLKKAGMDNPAITQLGSGGGMLKTGQQLSLDMPWSFHGKKWFKRQYNRVNEAWKIMTGGMRGTDIIPHTGELGQHSADLGIDVWKRKGGLKFDTSTGTLPNGLQTDVDIAPLVDALNKHAITNEFLDQLTRQAPDAVKTLKALISKYGTQTGKAGPMGVQIAFQDAPYGVIEEARKAMGELFRITEVPGMPTTISQKTRNELYGALKDTMRGAHAAVGPESVKLFDDAFDFWKVNTNADIDFVKAYMKTTEGNKFFVKLDKSIKAGNEREIGTMFNRMGASDELGERAVNETKMTIIAERGSNKSGGFEPEIFAKWWNGIGDGMKDAMKFTRHEREFYDAFAKAGDVFWPVQRRSGPLFVQQQLERPVGLLQKAGPNLTSGGVGGAGIGAAGLAGAAGASLPMSAIIASIFFYAPSIMSRVATSKALSKWVLSAAKIGPEAVSQHIGRLVGIAVNTKDPDELETIMQLYGELQGSLPKVNPANLGIRGE